MTKAPPKRQRSAKASDKASPAASGVPPWLGTSRRPGRLYGTLRAFREQYKGDPKASDSLEALKRLLTEPLAHKAWSDIHTAVVKRYSKELESLDREIAEARAKPFSGDVNNPSDLWDHVARESGPMVRKKALELQLDGHSLGVAQRIFVAACSALLSPADFLNPTDPVRREREIAAVLRRLVADNDHGDSGTLSSWERDFLFPDFAALAAQVAKYFEQQADERKPLAIRIPGKPTKHTAVRIVFVQTVGAVIKLHVGKALNPALATFTSICFEGGELEAKQVSRMLNARPHKNPR